MFACRMFGLHWSSDIPNPATGEFRDVRQTSGWRLRCRRKANWWNCDLRQILEFKDANTLPYLVINCEGVLSICTIQDISKHCPSVCISVYKIGRDISTLGFVPIKLRFLCLSLNPHLPTKISSVWAAQGAASLLISGSTATVFFPKELPSKRLGHLDMVISYDIIPFIYYNLHQFTSIFNLNFFDSRFCISNGQDLTWSRWLPQLPNMKPGSLEAYDCGVEVPSTSKYHQAVLYWYVICTYSLKIDLRHHCISLTLFSQVDITSTMFCELVQWNDWTESSTARAMFSNHNA